MKPTPRTEVRARFLTLIHHKATAGWCRMWAGSSWFQPSGSRQTILAFLFCGPGPGQHAEEPQQNAPLPEPVLGCFPLASRADAKRAPQPAGFRGLCTGGRKDVWAWRGCL